MNAYLFDIDGVLSNLKQELNKELIVKLSQLLLNGEMLGLISGRGFVWQLENVVKPIEEYIAKHEKNNTHVIDNLFVSGEFGGVSILHKNGERVTNIDESVTVPPHLRETLKKEADKYSDIVLVETEKHTMYSSAKKPTREIEEFNKIKSGLVAKYETIVQESPELEIHSDRYSVNIKHKKATKRYATTEVIDWLNDKGVKPDHFYAFGDSVSDFDIGEELFDRGLPMDFIFVGREEELKNHHVQFPYTVTKADFDLGTLEILNK